MNQDGESGGSSVDPSDRHFTMEAMSYAKVARRKLAPVPVGFRIYEAEWLGSTPEDWHAMKVTGAEFRVAKSGPNAGQLRKIVPGSRRYAIVTKEEMQAEEQAGRSR